MGCIQSRPGEHDAARRFNARKRLMKQAVLHRQAFAAAHFAYLLSLRNAGLALRRFASAAAGRRNPSSSSSSSPPLRPTSSSSASIILPLPPPPPPPSPPSSSSWDIVNPFRPSSPPSTFHLSHDFGSSFPPWNINHHHHHHHHEPSSYYYSSHPPGSSGADAAAMADQLLGIVDRLEEQFVLASACGAGVSKLLETRKGDFMKEAKGDGISASMISAITSWTAKHGNGNSVDGNGSTSVEAELVMGGHALVLQRLYSLEKKILQEVKVCEALRAEQQKKCVMLRTQEAKGEEAAAERTRVAVKKVEAEMATSYAALGSMLAAVNKMRDEDLHVQLMELAQGLTYMWRSMHECHGVQKEIVLQLKSLECWPRVMSNTSSSQESPSSMSEAVDLQKAVGSWHVNLCKLMSSHRQYVAALAGWCRLSTLSHADLLPSLSSFDPFVFDHHLLPPSSSAPHDDKENDKRVVNNHNNHSSEFSKYAAAPSGNPFLDSSSSSSALPPVAALCEEWQKALDRLPDTVVSEAVKSFCSVVSGLVAQQAEELKQKRKVERLEKRLEKKVSELRAAEKRQEEQQQMMEDEEEEEQGKKKKKKKGTMSSDDDEEEEEEEEEYEEEGIMVERSREDSWSVGESSSWSPSARRIQQQQVDPPLLAHLKAAVEALRKEVEEEKMRLQKCEQDTRVLTLNNMQTGLPGVFEALTGFSAVSTHAFRSLLLLQSSTNTTTSSSSYTHPPPPPLPSVNNNIPAASAPAAAVV